MLLKKQTNQCVCISLWMCFFVVCIHNAAALIKHASPCSVKHPNEAQVYLHILCVKCVCVCVYCKPTHTASRYSQRRLGCLKHQQSAFQMRNVCPVWMRIQRLGERCCVWCGNEWFKFSGHCLVFLHPIPSLLLLLLFWTSADGLDSISLFTPSCFELFKTELQRGHL